jgi:hypothetical protein
MGMPSEEAVESETPVILDYKDKGTSENSQGQQENIWIKNNYFPLM